MWGQRDDWQLRYETLRFTPTSVGTTLANLGGRAASSVHDCRKTFLVFGEGGVWHKADLYRVVTPKSPFDPAKAFIDKMIECATGHGLSEEYLARLVARCESLG